MSIADIDRLMMARCIELARGGGAEGEYPFGSLVAQGETVIAEAVNHVVRDRDESRHAEILAIAEARRVLEKSSLHDCTLYSTVEPCVMCSFCIRAAHTGRVVFALKSPVMGGVSRWNILQDENLSHHIPFLFGAVPEITSGVLADEVQKGWNDWGPFLGPVIKVLGFFVKP